MAAEAQGGERLDVSVIIPCYNTERFLDQAIASALASDRARIEVVAVDDGSTDGSLAIMRRHAAADARVRVIAKPNGGYGSAVNRGLDEARGAYVAILEPDDWVDAHMYDELATFARGFCAEGDLLAEDAPDVVKGPYWRVVGCGTPDERRLHCIAYGRVRPARQPFGLADAPRLVRHHPSIWSALYRRAFLEEHGIRMQEVPGAGWVDTTFGFWALAAAERIVYLEQPFYNYREDLAGTSSNRVIGALSFERWLQNDDRARALGITDRGIREALCYAGLRYIAAARVEGSLETAEVAPLCREMCRRMDPAIVAGVRDVSPGLRAYALELGGYPVPHMSRVVYLFALADEFRHSVRANGAGFALERVRRVLVRRG